MSRRRQRTFRTSVVSVLAAFSPLAACEDAGIVGIDSCPSEEPSVGARCFETLRCDYRPCPYGGHPTREFVCEEGLFVKHEISCNPPPLARDGGADAALPPSLDATLNDSDSATLESDAGDRQDAGSTSDASANSACPLEPPSPDAPCVGERTCGYEPCAGGGGHPTIVARCQEGKYQIAQVSCNPPPTLPDAAAAIRSE